MILVDLEATPGSDFDCTLYLDYVADPLAPIASVSMQVRPYAGSSDVVASISSITFDDIQNVDGTRSLVLYIHIEATSFDNIPSISTIDGIKSAIHEIKTTFLDGNVQRTAVGYFRLGGGINLL